MAREAMTLEELLVRHGAIAEEQLAHAREEQARWGGPLTRTLVDLGYISEELLLRAIAHQQRIPWVAPDDPAPAPNIASALTVQLCERFGVIAVAKDARGHVLRVATSDPLNETNLKAIAAASGYSVQPAAALGDWIGRAIRTCFHGEAELPAPDMELELDLEPSPSVRAAAPGEPLAEVEPLEGDPAAELAELRARVQKLEQLSIEDSRTVRVLSGVLVDLGFISRAELQARIKK